MEKAMPKSIKAWFEVQLLSGADLSQVRRSIILPFRAWPASSFCRQRPGSLSRA